MSEKDRRIADLESEARELREFVATFRDARDRAEEILRAIYAHHQPKLVRARDTMGFELRCRRCQTDDHHTWSNDNYVPWPCPTIAPFVAYAVYETAPAAAATEEAAE